MIAETISLGILSLPSVLAAIGLVPGVILILAFGLLATYTGFVVWQFKMAHPHMTSIAHGMELAFGRVGRWIAETTQDLMLVFVMAAHIVIFSVALNVLTGHAGCTTVWMAVGTVVSFLVSLPRTMKGNSWFSLFCKCHLGCIPPSPKVAQARTRSTGSTRCPYSIAENAALTLLLACISILTATLVALISIAITRPIAQSHGHSYSILPPGISTFPRPAVAVASVILAYNGHIAYPTIISEMKEPRDFPKALILLETITIAFYILVAVVINHFAGQSVAAPALRSASPLVRKIAYGFAVPTIIVAGVIVALVAAKQFYGYLWAKQPKVMSEKTFRARGSWVAILAAVWVLAWILACVIPIFGLLIGLIGAMFGTWFALGFPSMLWLGMNWKGTMKASYGKDWKKMSLAGLNIFIVVVCAAIVSP